MTFSSDIHARTFAICVGISDYKGSMNDLRVSDTDAWTISNIFDKNGDATIKLILNKNATRATVQKYMQESFYKAKKNDAILLYFSGHGMPGSLVCYDGLLTYSSILKIMKQSQASKKMIIVDACFSGKMRNTKKRNTNYSNEDVMFFLSSRSNELSQETPFKNSLFTIYLERGLRGGADENKDRKITAMEIYTFVHDGVSQSSKGRQHPVMWGKFDKNMPIIQW